jgi:hypothetical protein
MKGTSANVAFSVISYGGPCRRRPVRASNSMKIKPVYKTFWKWAVLVCIACLPAHAQDAQFLPELDAHLKLTSSVRAYLQAKDDRDGGDPEQFTIGPSIQYYSKPLLRLKKITSFDLDDSQSRALVLETGYRYITAPGAPPENRMETIATFHLPLKAGFLLSDQNRADLDWKNGFTWRYENKLAVERVLSVRSYHLIPYFAAEPYYESQYKKWSTTALYAGCRFPAGKHVVFNAYYEHENNTGESPNRQQNYIGLALYLYFSLAKK